VRELAPDVTTAKSGRTDTSLSVLLSEEAGLTSRIPDGAWLNAAMPLRDNRRP